MKVFLPPIDSRWRLLSPFALREGCANMNDNNETLWGFEKYPIGQWEKETGEQATGQDWVTRYHQWVADYQTKMGPAILPIGTVLQIERYHVSRSGEDQITLKILASPEARYNPKKLGGKMRGAGRLYLYLTDMNEMPEIEHVEL